MCKCIYCKLHFDRCWLLQKYKFHHRVSIGLYNCHSLPSNLHECQTYILQFSASVYERLPKEQIRNQLCNVKKGTEDQSAVRKICVAEGQIKARGKRIPHLAFLQYQTPWNCIYSLSLVNTNSRNGKCISSHLYSWSPAKLAFCLSVSQPSIFLISRCWCSSVLTQFTPYAQFLTRSRKHKDRDLFPTLKWFLQCFRASMMS